VRGFLTPESVQLYLEDWSHRSWTSTSITISHFRYLCCQQWWPWNMKCSDAGTVSLLHLLRLHFHSMSPSFLRLSTSHSDRLRRNHHDTWAKNTLLSRIIAELLPYKLRNLGIVIISHDCRYCILSGGACFQPPGSICCCWIVHVHCFQDSLLGGNLCSFLCFFLSAYAELQYYITLHYITFKVKNAEALQTLYEHYNSLEAMETTPRISEILVWFWRFAGNLMTSL